MNEWKNYQKSDENRRETIKSELIKFWMLINEELPSDFENRVTTWMEETKSIPEKKIAICFQKARLENKKFKIPTIAQVMEVWNQINSNTGSDAYWKKIVFQAMERRLENPEFCTSEQIKEAEDILSGIIIDLRPQLAEAKT